LSRSFDYGVLPPQFHPLKETFTQSINVLRALFGSANRYLAFVGFSDTAFACGGSFLQWLLRERERQTESLLF